MIQHFLQCGRFRFPMSGAGAKPLVMGILNVTPDSFSDGGQFHALDQALSHAEQMLVDGVDIIDIGGESSRPGALPLSLDEELKRVLPVIYALRDCGKPLSIDTYKPEVMAEALAAGVDMVNDIHGFRAIDALRVVKDSDCALCIMHMQRDPSTMQNAPQYDDVVREVTGFLQDRIQAAREAGIADSRICVDPGFGFGKTVGHNLALLKSISQMQTELGVPLLAGLSRKSLIGAITGKSVDQRTAGSVAAALLAAAQGARIVRVHDVAETVDALKIWQAVAQHQPG